MNNNRKYKVITLCGSIKYKDIFLKVQENLTLKGNIVFMPNFFTNIKKEEIRLDTKKMLDEMHKQKIDMSDEIYVINLNGYIGESTKSEIEYANSKGKEWTDLQSQLEYLMKQLPSTFNTYTLSNISVALSTSVIVLNSSTVISSGHQHHSPVL